MHTQLFLPTCAGTTGLPFSTPRFGSFRHMQEGRWPHVVSFVSIRKSRGQNANLPVIVSHRYQTISALMLLAQSDIASSGGTTCLTLLV